MDHILLSGPPGLGKTSLAMIIASSLGSELHTISGPALEKKGDLAAILTNIKPHDVLFIDYISKKLMVFEGEPAVSGSVHGPVDMQEGMNKFLTELDITMRRDEESLRPRINKLESQNDREQKSQNKRYYA